MGRGPSFPPFRAQTIVNPGPEQAMARIASPRAPARRRATLATATFALVLLGAAAAASAQEPDVEIDRRMPFATRQIIQIALDDDATSVWTGEREVETGSVHTGSILQLGGRLVIEGRVTGDVTAVDSQVYLRPGASIGGRLTLLGGGFFGTSMAEVGGATTWLREEPVRVEQADPALVRIVFQPPALGFPIELKGFAGIVVHEYNGVDGLLFGVSAGLKQRQGRPRTELAGGPVFRTARNDVGWNVAFLREFPRSHFTIGARAYRITETPERWHRGDLNNSLASLAFADDDRTYYERTGFEGWIERSFGLPVTIRARVRADQFDSLSSVRPFAFVGGDEDWRVNPPIEEGRGTALGATVTFDRRNLPDFPTRGVYAEASYDHWLGDFEFDWAQGEILGFVPVGGTSFVSLRLMGGGRLSAGDTLAPQFWYRLGGGGSIPGYELGGTDTFDFAPDQSHLDILTGDRMAFSTATVHLGLPVEARVFQTIYLVGIASIGDAWFDGDSPSWNASYGGGIAGRGRARYVGVFGVYGVEIEKWQLYVRLSPWF